MSFTILNRVDGPTAYFYAGGLNGVQNFGWINLFGLITVILLLLPNIFYTMKHRDERNLCENKFMNILEQVGRYGSMLFMVVCLKEGGYGFSSVAALLAYCFGNLLLLLSYWIAWGIYFYAIGRKPRAQGTGVLKLSLAVLPAGLFLLDGITLEYIPLIVAAVLFAVGHIYVTDQNRKGAEGNSNVCK